MPETNYGQAMKKMANNFNLNDQTLNTLEKYSSLMLRWNQRIQMTATRDPEEFLIRHVWDALELLPELPTEGSCIDVGSGGGLPGIVLAIACPGLQFTLIEPIHKKHAFLSTAKRELKLVNTKTYPMRDSDFVEHTDFCPFDVAMAKAVWPANEWLSRGSKLVRKGGIVLALEGKEKETIAGQATRREYFLPDGRTRSIVRLEV